MPMQKSQLHRLMRIAALLKENRYPNSETLVKEFRRIAVEEELEIDCGKKTILRDMKVLEHEFGCPLAFDRARNGYYLKHHGWDLSLRHSWTKTKCSPPSSGRGSPKRFSRHR